ncbi:MAG TPA: PEP-CTERM sorting domain-containing protein [Terriglobales bacterium]|nr:PEP-CTERM sorting domain-containing protein [Terriglobales bacterium]
MRTSTASLGAFVASSFFLVASYSGAQVVTNSDRIVISPIPERTVPQFGASPCVPGQAGVGCFNPLDQSIAETGETASPFSSLIGVRSGVHNATFNTAVTLLEPDGTASDFIVLSAVATPAGVQTWTLNFFSDTESKLPVILLELVGPAAQVQETGGLQDISALFLDSDGVNRITPLFNVLVQSDIEAVPEPSTWLLLGSGVAILIVWKRYTCSA